MPDPYRTSALATPSRKRVAFGTGELLLVHLPMSPDELVTRLRTITQEHRPTFRELRQRSHRHFCGVIQPTHFRLAPVGVSYGYLRVDGSLRPEGDGTVLSVRVTLLLRGLLLSIVSLAFAAWLVVSLPIPTDSVVYYAGRIILGVLLTAGGLVAAIRFGVSQATDAILAALDPVGSSDGAIASPKSVAPSLDPEELMKRVDDWERKHLK